MGKRLPKLPELMDTGRGWLGRLRLRAFTWVLGIGIATAAVILFTPISWVPAVGVAVAAAVVTMSKIADRLDKPTCYACGHDLQNQPDGEHGIRCPSCGGLHQGRRRLATGDVDPRSLASAEDDEQSPRDGQQGGKA
jgi:hypothetical protein